MKSSVQESEDSGGASKKKGKKSRLGDWKKEMKKMKKGRKRDDSAPPGALAAVQQEYEEQRSPRGKASSFQHVTMASSSGGGRRTSLPHDTAEVDRSSYRAAAAMANKSKKSGKFLDSASARELKRTLSFKSKKSPDEDFITTFRQEKDFPTTPRSMKKKSRSAIVFRGE